mmetsp:Transcript_26962/g.85474  ORF Transcript_26962/g.85474 Transcript_26962/m.85474 type:complete len:214 (+) Transcript_26962:1370-2011(+)
MRSAVPSAERGRSSVWCSSGGPSPAPRSPPPNARPPRRRRHTPVAAASAPFPTWHMPGSWRTFLFHLAVWSLPARHSTRADSRGRALLHSQPARASALVRAQPRLRSFDYRCRHPPPLQLALPSQLARRPAPPRTAAPPRSPRACSRASGTPRGWRRGVAPTGCPQPPLRARHRACLPEGCVVDSGAGRSGLSLGLRPAWACPRAARTSAAPA